MATARKVAGPGRLGSISAAKKSVKNKGGGLTRNIPADDSITVRFLEEPSEWFGFYEFWDDDSKSFRPVVDGEETPEGARPSFRYLANAYVVDDTSVRALKMPKSVVEALIARYEKHGTVLDRDYELSRSGSGLDTTYLVTPDSPSKMNLRRFKLIDLADLLEKMLEASDDDDEDDEDEAPRRSSSPLRSKKRTSDKPRRTYIEDEDDDEDDDDEDDEPAPRRRIVKKSSTPVKKTTAVRKSSTAVRKPIRRTAR